MALGKLPNGKMPSRKMPPEKVPPGKLPPGNLPPGKLTPGKLSPPKRSILGSFLMLWNYLTLLGPGEVGGGRGRGGGAAFRE